MSKRLKKNDFHEGLVWYRCSSRRCFAPLAIVSPDSRVQGDLISVRPDPPASVYHSPTKSLTDYHAWRHRGYSRDSRLFTSLHFTFSSHFFRRVVVPPDLWTFFSLRSRFWFFANQRVYAFSSSPLHSTWVRPRRHRD